MKPVLAQLSPADPLSEMVHDLAKLAEQIVLISERLGMEALSSGDRQRLFLRFLEWIGIFQEGMRAILMQIEEKDMKHVVDLELQLGELLRDLERVRRSGEVDSYRELMARDIKQHFQAWQVSLIPIGF